MSLSIHNIPLGPLETNSYILQSEGHCWLIDVGMWSKPMVEYLQQHGLTPERILLTHGHGDHIGGVDYVCKQYPDIKVACPQGDLEMIGSPEKNLSATFLMGITAKADDVVNHGDTLKLGSLEFQALATPGHTPGSMSYYCAEEGVLFSGDTLFSGAIGRSDIPGGDGELLKSSIHDILYVLPGETRVLPGHGPETTIAEEASHNPFVTL